jgi:hypothetical protein
MCRGRGTLRRTARPAVGARRPRFPSSLPPVTPGRGSSRLSSSRSRRSRCREQRLRRLALVEQLRGVHVDLHLASPPSGCRQPSPAARQSLLMQVQSQVIPVHG